MKKTYTRKQIQEAIAYWKKQLKESDADIESRVENLKQILSKYIKGNLSRLYCSRAFFEAWPFIDDEIGSLEYEDNIKEFLENPDGTDSDIFCLFVHNGELYADTYNTVSENDIVLAVSFNETAYALEFLVIYAAFCPECRKFKKIRSFAGWTYLDKYNNGALEELRTNPEFFGNFSHGEDHDAKADKIVDYLNSLNENISANKKKNSKMKKTYTKKQIKEAIAYWKKQLAKGNYRKVNEVFEYSSRNPYDIDNCKASGWVVFFMRDGFPYLPVDFSMPVHNPLEGDESDELSQNTRNQVMQQFRPRTAMLPFEDGVQMNASFFTTAQDAKNAMDIAEIDSGAYFGTSCYLSDCKDIDLINDDDIAEFETAENIKVVDTYVCGNDVVIFGRDALDDNADEWERENR